VSCRLPSPFQIEIQALPKEKQVIDFDPPEDTSDVSALVETEMESDAAKETADGVPLPDGSAG
jgi:hypothetical protein